MKPLALVLGSSLALNVGLVATFFARPALAPPSLRDFFARTSSAPTPQPPASAATAVAPASSSPSRSAAATSAAADPANTAAAELWSRLAAEDLPALVARLRAAGFSASLIRAIVEAEIHRRFADRFTELRRVIEDTPYWRADPTRFMGGSSSFYERYSQLSRERSRAVREVLGKEAFAYAGVDPSEVQRRQFGDLPPGKIEMVQRVADDYAEMISQVRASMQGITLPEDREKLALLEREKKADLAAILTPEELADYEMRSSNVTMRLRTALTVMDATEDEFRKIYQAHVPHAEVLYPQTPTSVMISMSDPTHPRNVAYKAIETNLTQALGADRYAQYQRATDREFQQLYQLTRAENTPYETVVRAHDTRTTTAAASMKIAEDPALNADAKRAALKQLAEQSRSQLLSTLGPTAGPTYTQAAQWLNYLEQGRAFSVLPGGALSSRSINIPRPVPTNP